VIVKWTSKIVNYKKMERGCREAGVLGRESWELQAASGKLGMANMGIRDIIVNVTCQTVTLKL
jgi:hypothetical protein